jgi:hypothetical protein
VLLSFPITTSGGTYMDKTTKNSLVWGGVLLIEAIILKLIKKSDVWFYIALPIIAGFVITELVIPMPKKTKRNLK